MKYNWQLPDWPHFTYSLAPLTDALYAFVAETSLVSGMLDALPKSMQWEAIVDTMVAEAIKTSEIEGEYLSREDIVSSVRHHLGLSPGAQPVTDRKAAGAAKLMFEVRSSFAVPLTEEMLFEWHKDLLAEAGRIKTGAWRSGGAPMQIVSGALGKEIVHFEAPPSDRVAIEMSSFIDWFNSTAPGGENEIKQAPVRAAITHLYFESIHPFEDGNGRVGRAIAEKALSQSLGRPVLLSLSRTIEANRKQYYAALKAAQRSNEISQWIAYFLQTTVDAQRQARALIDFILQKTRFFDRFLEKLNERQLKVVNRMLDAGPAGFEGGMNARKYMSVTKTSKATATRDLQQLVEMGAFSPAGGGRSTHYTLCMVGAGADHLKSFPNDKV